jgi:hypothetical protein
MVEMNQSEGKRSMRLPDPVITGIFGIISALIGAYIALVAADKLPNPFEQTTSQTAKIAGTWIGTINSVDGVFLTEAVYSVQPDCTIGKICGSYDTPELGCKGNLIFNGVKGSVYEFIEAKTGGPDYCLSNGVDRFTLYSESELGTSYSLDGLQSTGILTRK